MAYGEEAQSQRPASRDGEAERLESDARLDDAALYDEEVGAAPATAPAPPGREIPRLTRILLAALVGGIFFLAGVQAQNLLGATTPQAGPGAAEESGESEAGGADGNGAEESGASGTSAEPPGQPRLARGEITMISGSTLYLRDAEGRTTKLRVPRSSLIARARKSELSGLRPGEVVVAEIRSEQDALTAQSITVLPDRRR